MNQGDRNRLVALKKAKELITQKEAAKEIGITERQVRRLLKKSPTESRSSITIARWVARSLTAPSNPFWRWSGCSPAKARTPPRCDYSPNYPSYTGAVSSIYSYWTLSTPKRRSLNWLNRLVGIWSSV